jgi:hypothetical protein
VLDPHKFEPKLFGSLFIAFGLADHAVGFFLEAPLEIIRSARSMLGAGECFHRKRSEKSSWYHLHVVEDRKSIGSLAGELLSQSRASTVDRAKDHAARMVVSDQMAGRRALFN